jgi:transposase-like protein
MTKRLPERGLSRSHAVKPGQPLEEFLKKKERGQKPDQPFKCNSCGYTVNVGKGPCQNCGRDFIGRDGQQLKPEEKEARAGLRADVSQGFTGDDFI